LLMVCVLVVVVACVRCVCEGKKKGESRGEGLVNFRCVSEMRKKEIKI